MTISEKVIGIEDAACTLGEIIRDCATMRTRAQIADCHIKAEDHNGEYELTTNELDDAIEIMYKVEAVLGEALKNYLVALGS